MARVSRRAMNAFKNQSRNVVKEATETVSKNIDEVIPKVRALGSGPTGLSMDSVGYEILDAVEAPKKATIKDKINNTREKIKQRRYEKPIEIKSSNYKVMDDVVEMEPTRQLNKPIKEQRLDRNRQRNQAREIDNGVISGIQEKWTREEKIARNRGRNKRKEIDNGVIEAGGSSPLLLESREAKVEKAFDMLDTNPEAAEKILDSFTVNDNLSSTKKPKTKEQIELDREKNRQAFEGQHIPKERPQQKKQTSETSPSGGNESAKKSLQDKIKGNNFVYNMAAMGVGGGLVLNLANNKGQQSNAQLYGQY